MPPIELTLEERAINIAEEHGISTTTFVTLIEHESSFNPEAYNEKTGDRGLLQINEKWHPEVSDGCAYDPDCAMGWAAKRIKDGYLHEWVVANCYAYVRTLVSGVPLMHKILPNAPPSVGTIAIFMYKEKHVAYVEKLTVDGFYIKEANYIPATLGSRFVRWDDPALRGFWSKK